MNNDKGLLSGSITILIGAVIQLWLWYVGPGRFGYFWAFYSLGTVGSFDPASPLYAAGPTASPASTAHQTAPCRRHPNKKF